MATATVSQQQQPPAAAAQETVEERNVVENHRQVKDEFGPTTNEAEEERDGEQLNGAANENEAETQPAVHAEEDEEENEDTTATKKQPKLQKNSTKAVKLPSSNTKRISENLVMRDMQDYGDGGGDDDEELEASMQGSLSVDDAFNILTDVGYSGKQNLHGPDAHISPMPGQVYLFYFPIERHPYKRFKINDGWYWHNKSKVSYPREAPKIVKVSYKATGWRSGEKVRPDSVIHTRKVYWLTTAETNEENAVILVEYVRESRRSDLASSLMAATAGSSASQHQKAAAVRGNSSSSVPQKMQTKRKILIDPPARVSILASSSSGKAGGAVFPTQNNANNAPKRRLFAGGMQTYTTTAAASQRSRGNSDYAENANDQSLGAEPQYSSQVASPDQMVDRIDDALRTAALLRQHIDSAEAHLLALRQEFVDAYTSAAAAAATQEEDEAE